MICDSHGNPLDFVLTQGQVHDCTQSSILLTGWNAVAVIADKGYCQPTFELSTQAS